MKTTEKRLICTNYPSGRWVATGQNGQILTSESDWETSLEFYRTNDCSAKAIEIKIEFDWPASMFEPATEHTTEAGEHLFTDRGNRVTFDRVHVTDHEIRLALVHAENKFGKQLTLTGDDQIFARRMARLADDMGLTILNPELQTVIAEHRAQRLKAAPKPKFSRFFSAFKNLLHH